MSKDDLLAEIRSLIKKGNEIDEEIDPTFRNLDNFLKHHTFTEQELVIIRNNTKSLLEDRRLAKERRKKLL